MKIKFVDTKAHFGEGYYPAIIDRLEPYKTKYGDKLLIWLTIKNTHGSSMIINDFLPIFCTDENLLGKIFKIACPGINHHDRSTELLASKPIGIVLVRKIRKGKSYLNVANYCPLRTATNLTTPTPASPTPLLAEQIATILASDPALAKKVASLARQLLTPAPADNPKAGTSKIGDILKPKKGKDPKK